MKNVVIAAACVAALSLASCSTVSHTAHTEDVATELMNRSTADLNVADRLITYKFVPTSAHQRAGMKSMKAAAVSEALAKDGDADVLVAPQFEIKQTRGLFTTNVKYIIVKGHAGKYNNIHATTQGEANVINTLNGGLPAPVK